MATTATKDARDPFGGLRCRVPGCRVVIHAMTGLQEINKLRRHFTRAHLARLAMIDALELREKWERDAEGPEP